MLNWINDYYQKFILTSYEPFCCFRLRLLQNHTMRIINIIKMIIAKTIAIIIPVENATRTGPFVVVVDVESPTKQNVSNHLISNLSAGCLRPG